MLGVCTDGPTLVFVFMFTRMYNENASNKHTHSNKRLLVIVHNMRTAVFMVLSIPV